MADGAGAAYGDPRSQAHQVRPRGESCSAPLPLPLRLPVPVPILVHCSSAPPAVCVFAGPVLTPVPLAVAVSFVALAAAVVLSVVGVGVAAPLHTASLSSGAHKSSRWGAGMSCRRQGYI
jgi:hypothetical protein